MNILTHPVHTGYQFDLARTGHQFYSLDIPSSGEVFWDFNSRPKPENYHRISFSGEPPVKLDLTLVHFEMGYQCLKRWNLPIVWKEHCIRPAFSVPEEWLNRVGRFSFASRRAAEAWKMPPKSADRKCIIGMGMDLEIYRGHTGRRPQILAVGQNIRSRGNEKGLDNLVRLAQKFPITVVGRGNDGIPGAVGHASNHKSLVKFYQEHQIFLNPSNTMGMSTLEAMATGMPVVCFRMINSDVVRDGINGIVVESLQEAERALRRLLKDREYCLELGRNARATIERKFRMESFVRRWNALFEQVVDDQTGTGARKEPGTNAAVSKSPAERKLAVEISSRTFKYHRVGFDRRKMTFLQNGRVGLGAAGCELFWDVKVENKTPFLEIYSWSALTCRLTREPDGSWTGRWLDHEKMPIIVAPVRAAKRR